MSEGYTPKDIFCTYGSLRVSLSEAIDVFPELKTKNKRASAKKSMFFVSVAISDTHGRDIVCYNTAPQVFYTGESAAIGEEFIFDGVASSNALMVSFYSVVTGQEAVTKMDSSTSSKVPTSTRCLGLTSIPISRLEENKQVSWCCLSLRLVLSVVQSSQWYQMFSDIPPNEGLRCAARIEVGRPVLRQCSH